VDPRSRAELQAALVRLLESADLRRALGMAGRQRARQFRWQVCAAKSLEFFRRVAGE
jgi:glycosyltransferase involved in cell wall biosynthesis